MERYDELIPHSSKTPLADGEVDADQIRAPLQEQSNNLTGYKKLLSLEERGIYCKSTQNPDRPSSTTFSIESLPIPTLPALNDVNLLKFIEPLLDIDGVEKTVFDFQPFIDLVATRGFEFSKLGEGAYGDVYRAVSLNGVHTRIFKVMPLRTKKGKFSRNMKFTSIEQASSEIEILLRMQEIHGFVDVQKCYV